MRVGNNGSVVFSCFLMISGVLFFASCATPYQPLGFRGGYSDFRIDHNTFQIRFRGNGSTPRERVETFFLYRCAEITARGGYDYFIITGQETESQVSAITIPGISATISRIFPAEPLKREETLYFISYVVTARIRAFNGEKPRDLANAHEAKELIRRLEPRVERK